jgi:hypothetical protein
MPVFKNCTEVNCGSPLLGWSEAVDDIYFFYFFLLVKSFFFFFLFVAMILKGGVKTHLMKPMLHLANLFSVYRSIVHSLDHRL